MSTEPELGQVVSVEEGEWRSESWTRKQPSVLLHHEPETLASLKLGPLGSSLVPRSANRPCQRSLAKNRKEGGIRPNKCICLRVTSRAMLSS